MIKNIIGGIAVGIANVIPGVSGGTMMVILGIFNRMTAAISDVFKKDNDHRKDDIIFLAQVLIGAGVGVIVFAKILEYLFAHFEVQTMFWFVGLVMFSVPIFLKDELKGKKLHLGCFVAGLAIIFLLEYLNPGQSSKVVNPAFPAITFGLLIREVLVGFISGATMIMPGVSGSMVLLILGEYYLFKSYLANVTSFSLDIIIPLGFMAIGILLGIVLSSKFCKYAVNNFEREFLSVILGLIVASSIVLIPFNASYDAITIISSFLVFLLGGAMVTGLSKIE
jgi:putative membrane protein